MKRILLLGPQGQLGWELRRSLAPLGEVLALDRHSPGGVGDLENLAAVRAGVRQARPDIIVNAAAYTAVDRAEMPEEQARVQCINADAPALLAGEAAALGATLVHYSTDYVFDGSGERPWREDDAVAPLNAYGRSKLAGEQAILASGCRHLVLRTSWVYASRGQNFIRTMLRLARERDSLRVVSDQVGAPTTAELLADVTAHALRRLDSAPELSGLYHLTAGGETSWHGLACHALAYARAHGETLRAAPEAIDAIPSSDYPTPAPRPLNSRLDTRKLQHAFDVVLPVWQQGADRVMAELLGN